MSTNLKIAKASIILIIASILGHALSLSKEILIAANFGISKNMDAFYAAITIPNLITNVLMTTIAAVFIPIFIKYKFKDNNEANRIASIILNYIVILLIVIFSLLFLLSPFVVKHLFRGFTTETAYTAYGLLRILSFSVILSGFICIFTCILNANEHFAWPAFSQMFITVSTISFILLFLKKLGIFVLVYGLIAGMFFQFLVLIAVAVKKGYRYCFSLNYKHPAIKEMFSCAYIFLIAMIVAQFNVIIDRVMASYLDSGSIAALGYADKLIQVPIIIFSGSIATAVLPYFSAQVAENKIENLKDSFAKSVTMSGFIFIPLTIFLMILARPIIQLLFQRGAFTKEATDLTSIVFICHSFMLFSYFATVIMARLLLAFQDTLVILKIFIVYLTINIILNFIFINVVNPPVAGIALSKAVGTFIISLVYFYCLKRRLTFLHGITIIKTLAKVAFIAIISGIVVWWLFNVLDVIFKYSIINQVIKISGSVTAGCVIFIMISSLFKLEESKAISNLLVNKIINFKRMAA